MELKTCMKMFRFKCKTLMHMYCISLVSFEGSFSYNEKAENFWVLWSVTFSNVPSFLIAVEQA